MSQPNDKDHKPGREAWRDGNLDPKSGEFEQYAARGRELLGSPEEANDLLAELDQALDEFASSETLDINAQQQENASVEATTQPKTAVVHSMRSWLAVAASVALLIATAWWLLADSSSLIEEHFVHYDSNVTVRTLGVDQPAKEDEAFVAAMAAYDRKDYPAAISALAAFLEDHPRDKRARFYLGISFLAEEQADKALLQLAQTRISEIPEDVAVYYWALAAKAAGRWDPTNTGLRDLANSNSTFADRAKALQAEP